MPYTSKEDRNIFGYPDDPYDIEKDWRRPDQNCTPLMCKRRTTDMSCLILFSGALTFIMVSIMYASVNGSVSSYFGFTDYKGNICGVSGSVADNHYLYMCRGVNGGLDEDRPICVNMCPSSAATSTFCPGENGNPRNVNDYATRSYAGKLCMPEDPALKEILRTKISREPGMKFFLVVTETFEDMWPIVIAVVMAILLGFLQLFLLRRFGMCFVWIGFVAMIGVPLVLGVTLISASYTGNLDDVIIFGDEQNAYTAGLLLVCFSLVLSALVMLSWRDLLVARMTTKAAVECILDTIGLLVEPFLAILIRMTVFVFLFLGFLLLSSSEGWQWEGFQFDGPLPMFMVLYVLAALWVMEVCSAFSQFVAAWVTEEWFFATYNVVLFSKDVDQEVMRKAYYSGVRYHLGTLACGAAILPAIRGPRALMGMIANASRDSNSMVSCIASSCGCMLEFYYKRIECLNRSAYFEVALNSLPFQPAAVHALQVLSDDATDVLSMHGASWLIELGGAGGITACCVAFTHFMCETFVPFADPMSPYHVANPLLIDIVTALTCYPIAMHFLLVVSNVSDCILFCCALERTRNPVRTVLGDVGTGLLSRFNVCASDRTKEGRWYNDDTNQLPNTRALLSTVTKGRRQPPDDGDSSSCISR